MTSRSFRAIAAGAAMLGVGGLAIAGGMFSTKALAAASQPAKPFVQQVANFRLPDQNLQSHELYRLKDAKAVVIFTTMNGCPIVRNTAAALKTLRDQYKDKGVEFFMLDSNLADKRDDILAEAKEWGYDDLPILIDAQQRVGEQLGVTRTAEAFVIDPKRWQVVYRGPIDDRVVYERQKAKADETWAKDALDALLSGKPVKVAEQQTLGCIIDFPRRDKG